MEKITLTQEYLKDYVAAFERRYSQTVFDRQEAGYVHNSVEWSNWLYERLKENDIDGMLAALNSLYENYQPGKLSEDALRSSKNLAISLISCISNFAARDRIVDNELALTAADVCIMMCEETQSREELIKCCYAGLVKLSDLMQEYRNREYHQLVRYAREYVYKHLHEEIQVKKMARDLSVSPEHLSRAFHKAEGITLKEYIMEERIERARNLLRFSEYSIAEISRYLAFSSQSHFTDIFHRKTGKTPGEYRRDFSEKQL